MGYTDPGPIDHAHALLDLDLKDTAPGAKDLLVEVRAVPVNPVDAKVRSRVGPEEGTRAKVLAMMRRAWFARAPQSAASPPATRCSVPARSIAPAPMPNFTPSIIESSAASLPHLISLRPRRCR